jgi:hypothetical protein
MQLHKQKHNQHDTQHLFKTLNRCVKHKTKNPIKPTNLLVKQHKTNPINKTKTNSHHTTLKIKFIPQRLLQETLCKQLKFYGCTKFKKSHV